VDVIVLAPHPTFPIGNFKKKKTIISKKFDNGVTLLNFYTITPKNEQIKFLERVGYYLIFSIFASWWLIINNKKYEIVMSSSPPLFTFIPGYISKLIFHKKYVLDIRDYWVEGAIEMGFVKRKSFVSFLSKFLEKIAYKKSDLIFTTTQALKNEINKKYYLNKNKTIWIPNGVDTDEFKPSEIEINRIIYAGNIGTVQDLQLVILAIKSLKEYGINMKLTLVGGGDSTEELKFFIKQENLTDSIEFLGVKNREDTSKLISESMMGVAPVKKMNSTNYIIPTKIYEYMGCGIPFIACGGDEIKSIVKKSEAGLFSNNTVGDITENILKLYNNKGMRVEMGNNGRKYVEKYFQRKYIIQKIIKAIRGLNNE